MTELGVVPCIFIPRSYYWAICANILFQSSLLLFTGTTFTLFFYSMTAASLAFVNWPEGPLHVMYDARRGLARRARRASELLDMEGKFAWTPVEVGTNFRGWLELRNGGSRWTGFRALRTIVLFNPLTYLVIAGLIAIAPDGTGWSALYRRVIVSSCLILLMPPLAWIVDKLFPDDARNDPR